MTGPLGSIFKKRGTLLPIMNNSRFYFLNKSKQVFFNFALLKTIIQGVSIGYRQKLKLIGVGYRAYKLDSFLVLKIGFSHEIFYMIPQDVQLFCSKAKGTLILLKGKEKFRVNQIASEIRAFHIPDVYKGKGIRYKNEIFTLKKGKHESS